MVNYCREFCTLRGFTTPSDWKARAKESNEGKKSINVGKEEKSQVRSRIGYITGPQAHQNEKSAPELELGEQMITLNTQLRKMGPLLMFSRLPINFTLKSTYTRVENLHPLDFSTGLVTDAWISASYRASNHKAIHTV